MQTSSSPSVRAEKSVVSLLNGLYTPVKKSFNYIYEGVFLDSLFYSNGLYACLYASITLF